MIIGRFADYFATAVRTEKGISMLLIPRCDGVETKPIKTSYSPSAGTAYVTFDNVSYKKILLIHTSYSLIIHFGR